MTPARFGSEALMLSGSAALAVRKTTGMARVRGSPSSAAAVRGPSAGEMVDSGAVDRGRTLPPPDDLQGDLRALADDLVVVDHEDPATAHRLTSAVDSLAPSAAAERDPSINSCSRNANRRR